MTVTISAILYLGFAIGVGKFLKYKNKDYEH